MARFCRSLLRHRLGNRHAQLLRPVRFVVRYVGSLRSERVSFAVVERLGGVDAPLPGSQIGLNFSRRRRVIVLIEIDHAAGLSLAIDSGRVIVANNASILYPGVAISI